MERNIPRDASESIDFYLRTIYSVLRSRSETRISGFEEAHAAMNSTMHHGARSKTPDFNAFIYGALRMPSCLIQTRKVILGQNSGIFIQRGFSEIEKWEVVSARARRRFCQFDGVDTLACYITSKSDIDDIVPILTAFQIEWNKMHELLREVPDELLIDLCPQKPEVFRLVAHKLLSPEEDLLRLYAIWGDELDNWLLEIKSRLSELRIRLLDSSVVQYARSANGWIENIKKNCPDLSNRPIYFISSNMHSGANMVSGYALMKKDELIDFLKKEENCSLLDEWHQIEQRNLSASKENFLYYILKKYQQTPEGSYSIEEQRNVEGACGVKRIASIHSFDISAQVMELAKINPETVDPRINMDKIEYLRESDALILNIDYPLGLAAYYVLSKLSETFEPILGIYIMGKAASLNGIHGDIIIPTVIHDMHSDNTYIFPNAFSGEDIEPYMRYGSILGNQRAVSVYGTYLQNPGFMDALYRTGYTDIEMEGGPFLSAFYEMVRPKRYPTGEIIDLYNTKSDLGLIHYVSDTPMSKGKNLGAGTLSYFGMDSTYAATTAIIRRIFHQEIKRIAKKRKDR